MEKFQGKHLNKHEIGTFFGKHMRAEGEELVEQMSCKFLLAVENDKLVDMTHTTLKIANRSNLARVYLDI